MSAMGRYVLEMQEDAVNLSSEEFILKYGDSEFRDVAIGLRESDCDINCDMDCDIDYFYGS